MTNHHVWWDPFWSISWISSLQMLLIHGNIAQVYLPASVSCAYFCLPFMDLIFSQLELHLSNHCCEKQPKINLKRTIRHKSAKSLPVSSVMVLQMSRQLRKKLCGFFFPPICCFPSTSEYLLGGRRGVVRHAAPGKGWTGLFYSFFSVEEHLHLVAWLGFFQKKTDYSAGN